MFFNRTKSYAVYINPRDAAPHETAEFVEERATWMGFFFHAFWCAYHRLWWHALVIALVWVTVLVGGKAMGFSTLSLGIAELFMRAVVAFEGNHWRQADLKRRGYILSDLVSGDGEMAAKQRFYQRWLDQKPA
jgi:hypothetical protein